MAQQALQASSIVRRDAHRGIQETPLLSHAHISQRPSCSISPLRAKRRSAHAHLLGGGGGVLRGCWGMEEADPTVATHHRAMIFHVPVEGRCVRSPPEA